MQPSLGGGCPGCGAPGSPTPIGGGLSAGAGGIPDLRRLPSACRKAFENPLIGGGAAGSGMGEEDGDGGGGHEYGPLGSEEGCDLPYPDKCCPDFDPDSDPFTQCCCVLKDS